MLASCETMAAFLEGGGTAAAVGEGGSVGYAIREGVDNVMNTVTGGYWDMLSGPIYFGIAWLAGKFGWFGKTGSAVKTGGVAMAKMAKKVVTAPPPTQAKKKARKR